MKPKLLVFCLVIGILNVQADETAKDDTKSTTKSIEDTAAVTTSTVTATAPATQSTDTEAAKDKRQIGSKDTPVYPNHRSDTNVDDDPEDPQESIYSGKPNQFIIRPVSPHQHQQHEDHQQPQLRNYPATIRPHSSQLLEQSQEIQHFAYLQDISRNHPKTVAATQGKSQQTKKTAAAARSQQHQPQYSNAEEAEQRYAVAIQSPLQQPQPRQYQQSGTVPYHIQQQHQQQQQQQQQHQQQQQQPYQIIPEEHFLKLIEEELQARAYHESQFRHQQQAAHTQSAQANKAAQQQHQQQQQQQQHLTERSGQGLGSYRQRIEEEPSPEYVQYVPRHRGGPKYLPLPQAQHQPQPQPQQYAEPQISEPEPQQPDIPPQLAYYQPQISYKTLPNHPLAKSSLEKEIEKLLAANKHSASADDNSNEPSAVVNQHHHAPPPQRIPRPLLQPKTAGYPTTPNSLLDANNQPFIPSLFQFSNYQQPTPIYPTQVPQHVIEANKLGPVVYPTQSPTAQPAQPSQYYYQEATPRTKPKAFRAKQYGNKIPTPASLRPREKDIKYYEYDHRQQQQLQPQHSHQQQSQTGPVQFFPSPPDPNKQQQQPGPPQPTHSAPRHPQPPPPDFRQYVLPSTAPSQSSIFVSQGTGVTTQSRPTTHKPKTAEDVKQLHLPQPGGKPLTQAEFQALVEAGYPVTAVPVPVPVPYEQYLNEHPEYRNQPPADYAQLMRFAHQQYQQPQQQRPRQHQRGLASVASEPSVKIVSSPAEQQTATGIGGGSVTYLRPIDADQKRRPRDEKETEVAGKQEVKN